MLPPNQFGGWYGKPVEMGWVSVRFNALAIADTGFNRCRDSQLAAGRAGLIPGIVPPEQLSKGCHNEWQIHG